MEAYKFDTKISEDGMILIPSEPFLYGKEVEIIILPKAPAKKEEPFSGRDFLKKWTGVLKNKSDEDLDAAKYDYLKKKHQ
jgi:bifunctional DNA-binding transcriptional regulator/antitoxin component of YhaV-PrlF toxin-antitoxin module